jgi:hypothetical protein
MGVVQMTIGGIFCMLLAFSSMYFSMMSLLPAKKLQPGDNPSN